MEVTALRLSHSLDSKTSFALSRQEKARRSLISLLLNIFGTLIKFRRKSSTRIREREDLGELAFKQTGLQLQRCGSCSFTCSREHVLGA